ncbi:metallophosphoesterase family protein [Cellulomonas fengjieae]|uniref:metallophosphoesterase family protein n=1 Tax=Cellulomonas fengjieae TaxID=2819978 RepID=UPI001AAF1D38|nr:metallophosphoesterase [Cellulomonas fengjieae]MBO3101276.1 metallophosphoesterase [Cellulomonas fengjieae]
MSHPSSPDTGDEHRWWPRALLLLGAVLVALTFGVTTASVESGFGPHEARYDVTTDDTITVDLGPLGTLQIDSPLPLTLGARVTVQEIPATVTELDQSRTLAALSGDLQSYLQFFSGPQATVQDVVRALAVQALQRTVLALVVLVGAWYLVRFLVGPARRAELRARVRPHLRAAVAGAVVVALAATVLTSSLSHRDRPSVSQPASSVFDGTPLEGARVTGRLGGVINTYGGQVVAELRKNEEFYAAADASLRAAWDERQELIEAGAQGTEAEIAAQAGARAGADLVTEPAPTEAGPGEETPSESPTPSPSLDESSLVTIVVVSDLHCNVGMAPLIRTLTERSGADIVLDAGDTTINGTSVEKYCVTTFARAVPDGVELVTSPGNHDSRDTSKDYARAGATVLDGSVIEVDGLRILGDSDPNETRVGGGGTAQAGDESTTDAAERLAEVACDDDEGVDLLLVHTPAVGQSALEEGCVPAQVSGHLHRRAGPELEGRGVRYISSSTAGAILGQATVGPLNGIAEMTVLRWDPQSRRMVDYQLVQVQPDTTVTVSPRVRWPATPAVPTLSGNRATPSPV